MTCLLLRHGETEQNRRGVYLGREDVSLNVAGIAKLRQGYYPAASQVFCSPLKRCIQSAKLIYPDMSAQIVPELIERDFGRFSGLTHAEIIQLPGYSNWGRSVEKMPFPDGEEDWAFRTRCVRGWESVLRHAEEESIAIITHGGVIMAILDHLFPGRGFYSWQCKNGSGYLLLREDTTWTAACWNGEGATL